MIIKCQDPDVCVVTGLVELAAANATQVRDEIRAALPPACTRLDLDFSTVTFVDSIGLGALIALHKTLRSRLGTLRLLQPAPDVRQVLEMTRLHHLLELIP
jgi:anti-sigma B factor antagonist